MAQKNRRQRVSNFPIPYRAASGEWAQLGTKVVPTSDDLFSPLLRDYMNEAAGCLCSASAAADIQA